ncbi:hypothetical protein [Endozoicomonas sp. ONNA2]|uniref:hypothetical protein n=1 Tax=Endozoicomonas sp. ONNA2 TaxID=2828741 RepID=UPI002148D956|nr:hypothetical protein [Endozoicomonas sp. ONNA2]
MSEKVEVSSYSNLTDGYRKFSYTVINAGLDHGHCKEIVDSAEKEIYNRKIENHNLSKGLNELADKIERNKINSLTTSQKLDEIFKSITHYELHPEMIPWVGKDYFKQDFKVLLLGESHYLKKDTTYHHDLDDWYDGVRKGVKNDTAGIKTREILQNFLTGKSKTIYRNTELALKETEYFSSHIKSPYTMVSFMNFFQRPAEVSGNSIKVFPKDVEISSKVLTEVIKVLMPDVVGFTSSLAFDAAKKGNATFFLKDKKVLFFRTSLPATAWWNNKNKKYKNATGREHFITCLNKFSRQRITRASSGRR